MRNRRQSPLSESGPGVETCQEQVTIPFAPTRVSSQCGCQRYTQGHRGQGGTLYLGGLGTCI